MALPLIAGCSSATKSPKTPPAAANSSRRPVPRELGVSPLSPALRRLLDYYDSIYDPAARMLRVEFKSPGYHTRIADGTPVHPTRESLIYSLALLQRNATGDANRAILILQKVLPLQDVDPDSPTCGVWPWLLEEPLKEMAAPDQNWADFCGAVIAQMLVNHADRLPDEMLLMLRRPLKLAAAAIRKRNVKPGYTNIAVLGGGVCVVAGELLDDPELIEYGRRRLQAVADLTTRAEGFTEYNSPPYTKVVIAECERILDLARDERSLRAAQTIRRFAWKTVAESFHPGTQQWAGPHSRTSRDRLRVSTVEFLSRRTGSDLRVHPTMADGKPRGYAVVRPLPCPEHLLARFRELRREPQEMRRTFVRRKSEADSIIGTTWFSAQACLGSVNSSSFWTQRKPLIAYWKTADDPAVVFRLRFVHDGRDFASMGVRTAQSGSRALSTFHSIPGRGDWHRSLDRPTDGRFSAGDLRIRYELRGTGVDAKHIGNGRYELSAGKHRVVIHTTAGRFAGHDVAWEVGRKEDTAYLDGVCYSGRKRTFDFRRPLVVRIAVGVELLDAEQSNGSLPPQFAGNQNTAEWSLPAGDRLRVGP